MKRNKKSDDAILEAFVLRAIETENQRLQDVPEEPLDKETDARLITLIQRVYKKERRLRAVKRYALRISACIVLLFAASITAILNVNAWKSEVFNFAISIFEDHGYFFIENDVDQNQNSPYIPSEIPAGFEKADVLVNTENEITILYENLSNGNSFIYSVYFVPANIKFDTENALITRAEINGEDILLVKKNENMQALGRIAGTDYQFLIYGTLTEDEILSIVNSIYSAIE